MTNNTITFSRETLAEYKAKCEEAITNKHDTFVWKGTLSTVTEGKRLISRFEQSFIQNPIADKVTIPYNF